MNKQTTSYAVVLRELARRYYQHELRFTEYRAERQIVLDHIDSDYNGVVRDPGSERIPQTEARATRRLGETMTFSTEEIVKATGNALTPAKIEHKEHT